MGQLTIQTMSPDGITGAGQPEGDAPAEALVLGVMLLGAVFAASSDLVDDEGEPSNRTSP